MFGCLISQTNTKFNSTLTPLIHLLWNIIKVRYFDIEYIYKKMSRLVPPLEVKAGASKLISLILYEAECCFTICRLII